MSAPNTNLTKERRRHWAPLLGMALAVLFGVGIILFWIADDTADAPGPDGAATQIDGRTGEPVDNGAAPTPVTPPAN